MLSAQISGFRPYSYLHSSESPFNACMKVVTTAQEQPISNEIPRILESDNHLAWVWKPNHLLVHRTDMAKHDLLNLKDWILETTDWSFAQPINRLDRPTSGLVLIARDIDTLKMVSEQFAKHAVTKTYLAIVRGWTEDEGVIESSEHVDNTEVVVSFSSSSLWWTEIGNFLFLHFFCLLWWHF